MTSRSRNNIITVLDVGTSKVVCLTARLLPEGFFEINGLGYCSTKGLRSGMITDIKLAAESIGKAIETAQRMSGNQIKEVSIGLSANTLLSHRSQVETTVIGREIGDKDLHKLLLTAIEPYNSQPLEILHSFLYDYIVDDHHHISNPIGLYGNRCSCSVNIISTSTNNLLNYSNCLEKYRHLKISHYIANPYAIGLSCLTPQEMELGVTLIDFGGGTTSVAIFENNSLVYSDGIAIGGNNITNDISICFGSSPSEAEKIKNLYGGTIITDNDYKERIHISSDEADGESQYITRADLIAVISARVEEILETIQRKLRASGIYQQNKIVITGGGSRLLGIRELISHIFRSPVRIGYPRTIDNLDPSINLELATAIGMLLHLSDQTNRYFGRNEDTPYHAHDGHSALGEWWRRIQRYFLP